MIRSYAIVVLLVTIAAVVLFQPVSAESGFWDTEIINLTGTSRYRTYYEVPDTILTNVTQQVNVTFVIGQIGGLTHGVKTQSVELEIDAKGKSKSWTIWQEVKEFTAPGTLGPIISHFKVLDSDFDMSPREAVTATISITVKFYEEAGVGGDYYHEAKKQDISAVLQSTTLPTTTDYVKQFLDLFGGWQGLLTIGVVVTVTVSITIIIKVRGSFRI
jgi:hypothetical protein